MVTATVAPGQCGWPAAPAFSVACLQLKGGDAAAQCTQAHGANPAQIYFSPYRPGATYEATGRGCGSWAGHEPAPDCQQLGPTAATL